MMSYRFAETIKRAGLNAGAAAMVAAVLLVVGAPAAARPRPLLLQQADEAAEQAAPAQRDGLVPSQQQRGVSLQQATAMAQSRVPGRVVRAETVQMGDRTVHEIRILGEDGRTVRTVRIDAQTGQFL
jgi:uncharacterized membrane protein YkoI